MVTVMSEILNWVVVGLLVMAATYWLIVIRGTDERTEKARQKLSATLMRDDKVISSAIQNRIASLFKRRELVAITNSRFISINRSLFGGFTMRDYQWKDLHDVKLAENILPAIFGSSLSFVTATDSAGLRIDGIPSDVASAIYTHAQSEGQAWEEKLRIRELEEKRAASGGVHVHSAAPGAASGLPTASIMEEIAKAKALLDAGAISDAEFQEIKARVLSRA
jgi:preprotein translocase subunit YajC